MATSSFGVAALTQRAFVACCLSLGCWQIVSLGLVDSWSDPGVGGIGWFGRIVELSFGQNFQKCTVPAWCPTTHPLGYFPKYLAQPWDRSNSLLQGGLVTESNQTTLWFFALYSTNMKFQDLPPAPFESQDDELSNGTGGKSWNFNIAQRFSVMSSCSLYRFNGQR